MRLWLRLAALIVVVAALAVAGQGAGRAAAQQEQPPTRVRFFVPYRVNQLNANLNVVDHLSGTCFAGSAADAGRADAWRCIAGNRILDPCFAPGFGEPAELVCSAGPWSGDVALLTLEAPAPGDKRNSDDPAAHLPWALELADGRHCTLLTGATGVVAGMRINYGCDDRSAVIGAPDRTLPVWRVHVLAPSAYTTDQMDLAAAWY